MRFVETCFNYCGNTPVDVAYFSSDEMRWINRIHKLKKTNPDEVEIIKEPEDNDGCIYCRVPPTWLAIQPPRKINMSEEQREASRARMKEMAAARKTSKNASD